MHLDLTRGSVRGGLIRFSLPLIAGNLLQQLYNLVDTSVHFSEEYCFPIRNFFCSGVKLRRPNWFLQIQARTSSRFSNGSGIVEK